LTAAWEAGAAAARASAFSKLVEVRATNTGTVLARWNVGHGRRR